MNKRVKSNSIRIIAGNWRGRRIPVLDHPGLRPTIDRVRETLFNWLMHDVAGANCLDLFAGSGVLGFECLSRGSNRVDFVESDAVVAANIERNIDLLKEGTRSVEATVNCQNALSFLKSSSHNRYDIVFLDPPFQSSFLPECVQLLLSNNWLNENALLYIEQKSANQALGMSEYFDIYRQGKAGQSAYFLYSLKARASL